ncbi:WXG100 family type VII secretion target [Nocardia donostiensis]|uniref:WXG100 family type VII secretion target n=1 Tax=Nocardia donostiensis TaxID=1538463 RepID=A0A1V2TLP9_9NOCA|nr:hypothetical protein [Nocardia donostiensis]ONM50422.1 hypothetical protein B0T46_00360 [Nocardia donostiensis]OQS17343.1 hypothetical protein B0T36_01800 [Nocardia donostiensis]OQS18727.1 hypothetical protein B0T44_18035 [Nocardia donostiensis]
MSTLRADIDAIRATQPGFQNVATQVAEVLTTLRTALEAEGECWGGDEIGAGFAGNYKPGAEKALKAVEILSNTLSAMATGANLTAGSLQSQDEAIAAALGKSE